MTIALPDLLLYCGALVILFLTPGPVWLAIMARALSGGFGAAWPLALGVAIGDMLWPLVAVLGISWILSVFDMFMLGMRWIACAVFLIMGVVGIIVASILNMLIFQSSMMHMVISVVGLLVFAGLTAYDTQRLKNMYFQIAGNARALAVATTYGALSLYLDFVNMFQFLLAIMSGRD